METGKLYCFKPLMESFFIAESNLNKFMAEAIKHNGGYFEVKEIKDIGEEYVTSVKFPRTGKCLGHTGSGEEYFEIYEDEFKYFTEYTGFETASDGGVQSMTLDVNKTNAVEMIQLIQQAFMV